jgi:hypothetical protein
LQSYDQQPSWRRYFKKLKLKSRILLRDVVTRWNSNILYAQFRNQISRCHRPLTADKSGCTSWKQRSGLSPKDLVTVLLVSILYLDYSRFIKPSVAIQKTRRSFFFFSGIRQCCCRHSRPWTVSQISSNHQTGKSLPPIPRCGYEACSQENGPLLLAYRLLHHRHDPTPRHETRNQKWEGEWIEEAESLVRDEHVTNYEKSANEPNMTPSTSPNMKNDDGFASFGDLLVTTAPRASDTSTSASRPCSMQTTKRSMQLFSHP